MLGTIATFCRLQFKRHIQNPALWLIALTAPIAAHYMVPEQAGTYTVLAINNAFPVLTSAVIGMELGIISALLLSPIVYIFLRVSRIKITSWQVEDVTPANRSKQMLGHWMADTALLWTLLAGLALSGIILSLFRLPLAEVRPLDTVIALLLIACPAFAFIAAIRVFFSSRPLLRGALGDVAFFFLWIFGIVMGSLVVQINGSSLADLFGYASPVINAIDEPVTSFVVGSAPLASEATIEIDALKGILTTDFIISRLFWIIAAALLAIFAGFAFKARKPKASYKKRISSEFGNVSRTIEDALTSLLPKSRMASAPLWTHIAQITHPGILILILLAISIGGTFLPFRGMVGPALWLVALFPLTRQSGLWENRSLTALTDTLPIPRQTQFMWHAMAGILIMCILCAPSFIRMMVFGDTEPLIDMAFIAIAMPLIITGLGKLTRSGVTARILLLIAWYMYMNV